MKIRFVRYKYTPDDHMLSRRRGHAGGPPEAPFDPVDPGRTQGWKHILQNDRLLAVKSEMYFGIDDFENTLLEPGYKYANMLPGEDYRVKFEDGEETEIRQAVPMEIESEGG